jgi:two-component system chemotaxis response regulator CheV
METNILLESGTNELEIVEFYIKKGSEISRYGVNVTKVLEIIRLPEISNLPSPPHPALLGVINLRGKVMPIVDLSVFLNQISEDQKNTQTKVIVTEFNTVHTAFMVSGVNRIHRISWESVEPPTGLIADYEKNCVTGIIKLEDRIIYLLDMEKIVSDLNPTFETKRAESKMKEASVKLEGKRRALIADDSLSVRKMLQNQLEKAGFEIQAVNDGKEAWEILHKLRQESQDDIETIRKHFNAIISDIEMPQMDGFSLTKRIKEDPVLKQLPVVLFSSMISEKVRHKGQSVGADAQISKPEIGELAKTVENLIFESQIA